MLSYPRRALFCLTLNVFFFRTYLNRVNSRAITFTFGQIPWERYEPPYPSSYGLNSTTTVLLGE